jgi:protein TonB
MDLQKELLESGKGPKKRGWKASATSIALHAMLVAGIVYAGQNVTHKVAAEKPMAAFITQGAAPPPPPPPPPPARSSGAPQSQPRVKPQPTPVIPDPLTPPVEIPKEVPTVELPVSQDLPVSDTPLPESTGSDEGPGDAVAGVVGGVAGGVAGGVVGGEVGGVIGGMKGGEVGGTGTGTEGSGTGGVDAPVAPAGPLRVGGDVKAPIIVNRADPDYTESARRARIAGIVIVEAIIDRQGNVDQVKVIKGLPMGLADEAVKAVKKWKFKPGTHNGQAVATIFNLTVNFRLDG